MHPQGVAWILGRLLLLYAAALALPEAVALAWADGEAGAFLASGAITAGAGLLMQRLGRNPGERWTARDGFLAAAGGWLLLAFFGALPFWLTGTAGLVDGLFESASGLTTTGATVLTGLDRLPESVLFWRSLQEWLGGMGIVVLAVAVMPMLGVGGMQLFRAEMPGPTKDKLAARIADTAKHLWILYLAFTAVAALTYALCGMGGFDAVNHAMTTIAIGGFSTHDASFAAFPPAAQLAGTAFMALAGINFTLHFLALRTPHLSLAERLRIYLADDEFRAYMRWLALLVALVGLLVWAHGGDAPLHVLFNAVSIATTTGYAVSDYWRDWPQATVVLLTAAMFVGASAGSTGGGMKVVRALLLVRQGVREIRRLVHPHGVEVVKIGGRSVPYEVRNAIWGFFSLYVASFLVLGAVVTATGADLVTGLSAAAACITNTGPGFGAVGPAGNYQGLAAPAKLALSLGMIVGRLELYTFFVLLTPSFWRR